MTYYIYPDGTISEGILDFMSDDYYELLADDDGDGPGYKNYGIVVTW